MEPWYKRVIANVRLRVKPDAFARGPSRRFSACGWGCCRPFPRRASAQREVLDQGTQNQQELLGQRMPLFSMGPSQMMSNFVVSGSAHVLMWMWVSKPRVRKIDESDLINFQFLQLLIDWYRKHPDVANLEGKIYFGCSCAQPWTSVVGRAPPTRSRQCRLRYRGSTWAKPRHYQLRQKASSHPRIWAQPHYCNRSSTVIPTT